MRHYQSCQLMVAGALAAPVVTATVVSAAPPPGHDLYRIGRGEFRGETLHDHRAELAGLQPQVTPDTPWPFTNAGPALYARRDVEAPARRD